MVLDTFQSNALRTLEVGLAGVWSPAAIRDWRGKAFASEPIVAVSFAIRNGLASWCKSERGNLDSQGVRLLLGNFDSAGRDVQVAFEIGDGQVRTRTLVASPEYRPEIDTSRRIKTGDITSFCTLSGDPAVQLRVLFLAASDVEVGRNGLWHLRSRLVDHIPESFRALLAHGRAGELAAG